MKDVLKNSLISYYLKYQYYLWCVNFFLLLFYVCDCCWQKNNKFFRLLQSLKQLSLIQFWFNECPKRAKWDPSKYCLWYHRAQISWKKLKPKEHRSFFYIQKVQITVKVHANFCSDEHDNHDYAVYPFYIKIICRLNNKLFFKLNWTEIRA